MNANDQLLQTIVEVLMSDQASEIGKILSELHGPDAVVVAHDDVTGKTPLPEPDPVADAKALLTVAKLIDAMSVSGRRATINWLQDFYGEDY